MGWVHLKAESYFANAIDNTAQNRVRVYADEVLIADYYITYDGLAGAYTQEVNTPSGISDASLREPTMRLPAVVASEWEVEISGTAPIDEFCLAQSMDEIRQS